MPLIIVPLLLIDVCAPSLPLISCYVAPLHPFSSSLTGTSDFKKGNMLRYELATLKFQVMRHNQQATAPVCFCGEMKADFFLMINIQI